MNLVKFSLVRCSFIDGVGAFNGCLHCKIIYSNISIRKLSVLLITIVFLSILPTFSMFLLFFKSFCFAILLRKNIKIMNMLVIRVFHIYILVTYVFHVWLYLILTERGGILSRTPDLNLILAKVFLFANGILIAFLRIILSKYPF